MITLYSEGSVWSASCSSIFSSGGVDFKKHSEAHLPNQPWCRYNYMPPGIHYLHRHQPLLCNPANPYPSYLLSFVVVWLFYYMTHIWRWKCFREIKKPRILSRSFSKLEPTYNWGDYDNWGIIYKLIPRILFDFLITLHK